MKWSRGQCVWHVLACLVSACRANPMMRTVMLLKSGSTNNFDTMWNTNGAINDPHGNTSLIYFDELASSTDFKADIDPAWGSVTELEIIGLNAFGGELFHAIFDVVGKNISQVDDWFMASDLSGSSLYFSDPGSVSTVVRDGNKELLILTNSNEAWFSIHHSVPGDDPKIVLSVNSSAALTTTSTVDGIVDEGCWANWELSLDLSYTDAAGLNVHDCVLNCSSSYVALQLARHCFCGDFISQISPVTHMCSEACPGDVTHNCGGISDGYYSVYSATTAGSELDSLSPTAESVALLTLTHTGGYTYTINVSAELFSRGWTDGYIFVDRISINATNSTGHAMLFSFEYLNDSTNTYTQYDYNGNLYFDTDGNPVDIEILLVEGLRIYYEWDVVQSTIELYGPSANSYVDIPMIAVVAHIDTTTSTTTVSTTDPSTTTTPQGTTTTDSGTTTASGITTTNSPATTTDSGTTTNSPVTTTASGITTTNSPATTTNSPPTTTDSGTTTNSPVTTTTASGITTTNSPPPPPTTTTDSGTTTDPATTTESPTTTTSALSSLYLVYPNLTVSINGTLYCPCNETHNVTITPNLTSIYQDSNKTFEELIADLTLDADTLSSNRRKYVSASDNRASSATLGTLAIVVIVSSVSFIVYLDSARLVQEASKIRKKYKILKKRLSKRSLRVETINVECKDDGQDVPDILK